MQKLDPNTDGKTMDIVADNIAKLKELFPEIVTEGKVDFEALKGVLGEYVEDREERYSFTWNGKSKARMLAQTPSNGTLRPCPEESVDFDSTQNLFIEGDNLEVLKLLQKSYYGKIKMIYIDPPYNTGGDFIYPDNFRESIKNYMELTGQVNSDGKKSSTNYETSGRYHTDWLNMMYPRLRLARNLLRDDGVIFISIDDCEVSNLRRICDEIFGDERFIAQLIWKSRQNKDNRTKNGTSVDHEYIVTYGKTLRGDDRNLQGYSNPDNDSRGDWTSANMVGLATADRRPNLHYNLIDPATGIDYGCPEMGWRYDTNTMAKLISEKRILWPASPDGRPRRKSFLSELSSERTGYSSIVGTDIYTRNGTADIGKLFETRVMDFPKPVGLIKGLINQADLKQDEIILDFFSGSATAAHAVMQLNAEDDGNRKFIMVQLPEVCAESSEAFKSGYKTIADIGKERIRRVIAKIKSKQETIGAGAKEKLPGLAEEPHKLDLGFKVLKLDSTNIKPWDADFDSYESSLDDYISNIKPGRSEEDVLYEILLKYGLDLTLPIETRIIADKKVFIVGLGALVLCLADGITLDVVEGIADLKEELKPEVMRVVFKDNGFSGTNGDVIKTNAIQILRQHDITDVKSL
ncbi:site-specific DNA-methyltransferase [Desulfovibrio sp. Huiquan2017]|uniref:site-specific DNA-methyltransferase n=1 Tax=Desulfovibrio sp. Huiquan2017 TaxID=2816861 RepID=UPI001A9133FE|nr:site-specific DNA-methyltransferase [Desulfovibrio sp. Huiquan2017]